MKRTVLFMACLLASVTMLAQEGTNDYIPFVELGKVWHVVSHNGNPNAPCQFLRHSMSEEVERDGKIYAQSIFVANDQTTWHEGGLFREENRRVYKYDEKTGRDFLWYDFSLKEGDTFTYDLGYGEPMNCKVLKQGWLADGPKIVSSTAFASADTLNNKYRRLHTWTIGLDNGTGKYPELMTWVEGIGALENTFNPLVDGSRNCIAYIVRNDDQTNRENTYLPFSFHNSLIHGCNLPTGAETYSEDGHHQLTYELEGDRLHVYGKVYTQCGPNNYAYFYESETDDPMVHRIAFSIQELEPVANCMALHATEFIVPGFDPNLNYFVVDNQGEEHPVINNTPQMAYRPFVEKDKVWKVGAVGSGNPVQLVEYYYFDGDTIIDGKTCKQMMCERYLNPDYHSQRPALYYVGAWYEEDKKVYFCNATNNLFKLMYDFSIDANDTLQIDYFPYVIGPRKTGGISGFKGVYRDVWECEDKEHIYRCAPWLEGVGGVYAPPTTNVFNIELADPMWFLMSCTVGDVVIYHNDAYEDGATPEEARKKRFDFTHTIKTKPKSRMTRGADPSLYGEYNDLQLGINLDPLDDAYLVRITDDSGKTVYEKAVNAGSIVGLNIDISSYPEGRYTVTVENSNESFTGEFDAQTTSILEVRSKRLDVRDGIYNLQGQRLRTLQKGLNIVNGQKVYVK